VHAADPLTALKESAQHGTQLPVSLVYPAAHWQLLIAALRSADTDNESYYTVCSLLVILKHSCSKLHRQQVPVSKPYRARCRPAGVLEGVRPARHAAPCVGCLVSAIKTRKQRDQDKKTTRPRQENNSIKTRKQHDQEKKRKRRPGHPVWGVQSGCEHADNQVTRLWVLEADGSGGWTGELIRSLSRITP